MNVAFAYQEATTAQSLLPNPNFPNIMYEVTLADPSCSSHRADMCWFDFVLHSFDGVDDCIRHYWRGDQLGVPPVWEWLLADDLIVVQRVAPIWPAAPPVL
jgi:hypothetical protein